MEWNAETVLDALNDFERKLELTPILNDYLSRIAKNGEIVFPWCKLKPLLKKKLEVTLDGFYDAYPMETSVSVPNFEAFNYESLKKTIIQAVDAFPSAPFTIQRLCELVESPTKHYNRIDKYMRGIEKNVLVVSTIEPRIGDGSNGNNPVVNGIDSLHDDNDTMNGHENADNVSSTSNLNSPSNHVLLENFANVFPSAICIPSVSNVCVNADEENDRLNFLSTTCADNPESEFDQNPPVEPLINVSKDEEMDTTEDDQLGEMADTTEISIDTHEISSDESLSMESASGDLDKISDSDSSDSLSESNHDSADDANVCENKNKAQSSTKPIFESVEESQLHIQQPENVQSKESPHNDKISQSDDDTVDIVQNDLAIDIVQNNQVVDVVQNEQDDDVQNEADVVVQNEQVIGDDNEHTVDVLPCEQISDVECVPAVDVECEQDVDIVLSEQAVEMAEIEQTVDISQSQQSADISQSEPTADITHCDQATDISQSDQAADTAKSDQAADIAQCDQSADIAQCDQSADIAQCDQSADISQCDQAADIAQCERVVDTVQCAVDIHESAASENKENVDGTRNEDAVLEEIPEVLPDGTTEELDQCMEVETSNIPSE